MERCVEEFVRSVRNGETVSNTTEAISTEHDLGNPDTASHSVVRTSAKKNKRGTKLQYICDICKVTVYDARTLKIHLNGKKHLKKQMSLLNISVGKEYIKSFEDPGGILSAKCELCCEHTLSVSSHLKSPSHILAYLKTNHPKVFQNMQLKGLNKIKRAELMRIVVAETVPDAFQQCANLDGPAAMENLIPDQKSGVNEDCEPPPKMAKMSDPSCIDEPDTITIHMKEKNSDIVQNEKKDNASDQRLIQPDCQQYQESQTRSDLEHHLSKSPFKIACNEDLYAFLKYFQISDETDVRFIQQIVKIFKGELKEFNENNQQVTTVSDLNGGKDQEESISKLKISCRSESILQPADSTTTSNPNECTTNKIADDAKYHWKGERINNAGVSEPSSSEGGRRLDDVSAVAHLPENNSSKVTTARVAASNSVSSDQSPDMLFPTTKKPTIHPSVTMPSLKSHDQSIVSIKKEPDVDASVEEPHCDCTTATNTKDTATANNSVSCHHSSEICPTTNKPIIRPSVFTPVLKSHDLSIASIKKEPDVDASVKEPQLDSTMAANTRKPVVTGTPRSHLPVFDSSSTLSTGKPKCIIRPSVLSSVLQRSLPLQAHVSIKKETDKHPAFPEGCIGSTKVQSHSFKSEFTKDQPPSMYLESSPSDKNTDAPAAKKPRIDPLNFPTSPSNTHVANSISFGGKKDMQISELIAEVAKFADTKPVLKGIDINQVVQILIRNRTEKTRNQNQGSTT